MANNDFTLGWMQSLAQGNATSDAIRAEAQQQQQFQKNFDTQQRASLIEMLNRGAVPVGPDGTSTAPTSASSGTPATPAAATSTPAQPAPASGLSAQLQAAAPAVPNSPALPGAPTAGSSTASPMPWNYQPDQVPNSPAPAPSAGPAPMPWSAAIQQAANGLQQSTAQQSQLDRQNQVQQSQRAMNANTPAAGGASPSPFTYQPQADTVPNSPALPGAQGAGTAAPTASGLMGQLQGAAPAGVPPTAPASISQNLQASAAPAPRTYDPNRIVSVYGQRLYFPTPEEQNQRALAFETAKSQVGKIQVTQRMSDETGGFFPVGAWIDLKDTSTGNVIRALATQERAAAAGNKVVAHTMLSKADNGTQVLITQYTDGSVKETPLTSKGASDKFDPANAAANATNNQAKALTENQRQESANKALKDYQDLLKQKQQIESENNNIGIALKTGQHYVDKDGHLTAFNKGTGSIPDEAQPGYQDAMRSKLAANQGRLPQVISDMQGAQNRYADLSGNQGARPQTAPAPAAPAAAPAPPAKTPASAKQTPAQKYNVGDVVTSKGQKYKVLGYNPDGSIKAQAL